MKKRSKAVLRSISGRERTQKEVNELRERTRKLERALEAEKLRSQRNQQQYSLLHRELFNNPHSGVAVLKAVEGGKDFLITDINQAGERIEGMSRDAMVGKSLETLFPRIFERGLIENFRRVLKSGIPEHHIDNSYEQEGRTVSYENSIYKLPSGEIVVLFNDTTRIKEMELCARSSVQRYQTLAENIPGGDLYLFDENMRIILATGSEMKRFGFRSEDWEGKHLEEILDQQTVEILKPLYEDALNGIPGNTEIIFRDQHYLMRTVPIFGPDGRVHECIGLSQNITLQKHTEEKLRTSVKRQETLLQEVHHRVKNNLQIINSLFSLQDACVRDREFHRLLMESKNRILSISLVHEELYLNRDLSAISIRDYLEKLAGQVFTSMKDPEAVLRIEMDLEELLVSMDTAVPCGLILNELLSNSVVHAFDGLREGKILISFRKTGKGIAEMSVSNDGRTLPDDEYILNSPGLGMKLVQALTSQLQGMLSIERAPTPAFRVVFPLPSPIEEN